MKTAIGSVLCACGTVLLPCTCVATASTNCCSGNAEITAYTADTNGPGGTLSDNGGLNIGQSFAIVGTNLEIFCLGVFNLGGHGLNAPHAVSIFANNGGAYSPLPGGSVIVPPGTNAPLQNGYRYQPLLAPIVLAPGTYAIIAFQMNGGTESDPYSDNVGTNNGFIGIPGLVNAGSVYQFTSDPGPNFPSAGGSVTSSGANFGCASFTYSSFSSNRQSITFSFTLDEPCKTSAGVFTPDGALVRTLWSKVRYYTAGSNSAVWDGFDDESNVAPPGIYEIKVLQHNTEYVWDGAIGNTSTALSGPTVHRGFWPMADMAISGTNAFYVSGYNEGMYDFRGFLTTNPQQVSMSWYWVYSSQFARVYSAAGDIYDLNWLWAAADNSRVYFACSGTPNPTNLSAPNSYPGCIVSCYVSNQSPAYFSSGVQIRNNGANSPLPNGIYVGQQPGLSGLAAQQNGSLLAVSVAPDNHCYLLDKATGATITSFGVNAPARLDFSPDNSLWVISGSNVNCYTNLGLQPALALTISNLAEPLAVAVSPANSDLILVADGGGSQQVKAFSKLGLPLWIYGRAGGYQSNGAAVATNKFWFSNGQEDATFLCFASDGSFWVGDGGNNRSLHFSAGLNYIEQIMYQPLSYQAAVDQNDPCRVFNQFLEFHVDYAKPLAQAWTLVNNWKANVDAAHISGFDQGVYEVTTFTNGRTYALIDNNNYSPALSELCELAGNYLRLTGIFPAYSTNRGWISMGPDGSARRATIGAAAWHKSTLSGFDTNNNPIWNPEYLLASASDRNTDPLPRCCSFGNIRTTISSNNILISFDQTLNDGWHLGGVNVGGSAWLWKASPAVTFMNGCGTYEISNQVQYAGNTLQAVDRNVTYGYHGEFFRGEGQACQNMHFYDDGLFVGQFGEATPGHSAYEGALPGTAANAYRPSLIKAGGDYYLWLNDEDSHGPQRWHFVNARNIREQFGNGTLGSVVTLTNPSSSFPSGLAGKSANQTAALSWQAVDGADFYNIRYSFLNGGPYSSIAGSTTNLSVVLAGLTNGQTYYFVVTAILGGVEGTSSEQAPITPFDTTQTVRCTGSMSEGGQFTPAVDINPSPIPAKQPAWVGAAHLTGVLDPRELDYYGYGNLENEIIGTEGYVIYDWGGYGSNLSNLADSITVTPGEEWSDVSYLERQYRIGNVLGTNDGWAANPVGALHIAVSDTNFHYLSVVSPAQFNNPRQFTLAVISTNQTSAMYTVNEAYGYSHLFQFLFQGDITLRADASGGNGGIVQALFFDTAPLAAAGIFTSTALSVAPSPSITGQPVAFIATVSAHIGTVSAPATTGTVIFTDGSTPLGTASVSPSGVAMLTNSALFIGPHSLTAAYSGGNGYDASLSTPVPQSVTAASYFFTRLPNHELIIPISSLMASNIPASGETLLFGGLPSQISVTGAYLSNNSASVFYSPSTTTGNVDSFSYAIENSSGTTVTGVVTVLVVPQGGILRSISLSKGAITLSLAGISGVYYDVQRAVSLNGPWATLATVNAPSYGVFSYTDTSPPSAPSAYYRLEAP